MISRSSLWFPAALAAAGALGVFGGAAHGGPIDPPPGPVAPTMKPLSEIEPRRAILQPATPANASDLVIITEPGSYYLASNLLAGTRHGIRVQANDVTIDLNGFTIIGGGTSAPVRSAVFTSTHCADLSVVNGSVTDFNGTAITGIVSNGLFERLRVRSCAAGIVVDQFGTTGGICRGNTFLSLRGTAVSMGVGAVIEGNSATYFGLHPPAPAIIGGTGARISGNTLYSPPSTGISVTTGAMVEGNHINQARENGILVGGNGIASVTRNTILQVGASGVGIRLNTGGVHVEGNLIMNCSVGILSPGGNSIVRNTLRATGTPLQTGATDVVGPLVGVADAATATNPLANIAF